jgi:hypothetical protein
MKENKMMFRQRAFETVLLLVVIVLLGSCSGPAPKSLWNGKDFSGWKRFIPGDSVDVNTVWQIKEGVIHCSGVPTGYMRTEASYTNFKLHVEWRWVDKAGNSGVLLRCKELDKVWPNCLECQLWSGNAGDFVLIGPGRITVNGTEHNNTEQFKIIKKQHDSNEKPLGEWNTYDIECRGSKVTCAVNGLVQNVGETTTFTSGPIALQSEGAAIEFRNITLQELP